MFWFVFLYNRVTDAGPSTAGWKSQNSKMINSIILFKELFFF